MAGSRIAGAGLSLTREQRPKTSKIIFISCEGNVTEEGYFKRMSDVFQDLKSKVVFVSVKEDVLGIPEEELTLDQKRILTGSKPYTLVEKIDRFKVQHSEKYDFENHPDDEFWIVSDVDDHTVRGKYDKDDSKTLQSAIEMCKERKYSFAVSNPYFELWLLLHFKDVIAEDYNYAVTTDRPYVRNHYFRDRLRPDEILTGKNKKEITPEKYNRDNIKSAIERAKALHNVEEEWPQDLGTTVYRLMESFLDVDGEY